MTISMLEVEGVEYVTTVPQWLSQMWNQLWSNKHVVTGMSLYYRDGILSMQATTANLGLPSVQTIQEDVIKYLGLLPFTAADIHIPGNTAPTAKYYWDAKPAVWLPGIPTRDVVAMQYPDVNGRGGKLTIENYQEEAHVSEPFYSGMMARVLCMPRNTVECSVDGLVMVPAINELPMPHLEEMF